MLESPSTLCSQGSGRRDSGIRPGDSGSALNYRENGRLSFKFVVPMLTINFIFIFSRFTVIGVTSYGAANRPSKIGDIPRVHARITPEIKSWIQQHAKNTQDSTPGYCSPCKILRYNFKHHIMPLYFHNNQMIKQNNIYYIDSCNCGKAKMHNIEAHIAHGQVADPAKYPWIVRLSGPNEKCPSKCYRES